MSIFGFHSHEHSNSDYYWNAHERGNQVNKTGNKGLIYQQKLSRIILDFAKGLQKIKRTVSKDVTVT